MREMYYRMWQVYVELGREFRNQYETAATIADQMDAWKHYEAAVAMQIWFEDKIVSFW